MVPLAHKDVTDGANRGLGSEKKAVMPIVTEYRREPVEEVHHYCNDHEKSRTQGLMIQFNHACLVLEVLKQQGQSLLKNEG